LDSALGHDGGHKVADVMHCPVSEGGVRYLIHRAESPKRIDAESAFRLKIKDCRIAIQSAKNAGWLDRGGQAAAHKCSNESPYVAQIPVPQSVGICKETPMLKSLTADFSSRRARRVSAKRRTILRAAKRFPETRFWWDNDGCSAQRARVSKTTVYRNFDDKEALFAGVISELCCQRREFQRVCLRRRRGRAA
jgi:Bacterial regulatory proteins, tetR family